VWQGLTDVWHAQSDSVGVVNGGKGLLAIPTPFVPQGVPHAGARACHTQVPGRATRRCQGAPHAGARARHTQVPHADQGLCFYRSERGFCYFCHQKVNRGSFDAGLLGGSVSKSCTPTAKSILPSALKSAASSAGYRGVPRSNT